MSTSLDPATLEALPACAWTADADGVIDWTNAEFARFLGQGAQALATDGWRAVVHAGDWPRVDAAWRASLRSGEPFAVTARLLSTGAGRYRWHLCRARRVEAEGGPRWVGLNADIDASYREIEQKHASIERLRVERERFRAVFADCPVAITVYEGIDHRIVMMNRANERVVGGRNLEGRTLASAFPEMVEQGLIALLDHVLETGEPYVAHEHPLTFDRRGDGRAETGYFDFSLQALTDGAGHRYGILACGVDMTEQVLARRQVERLAAEREAVLAQLGEGLILTDIEGRITFVNDVARRLHGVAHLDVMPDAYARAYSLLREDGAPYPSDELPLARAVRHGETVAGARWRIRRPDGSEVLAEGTARPVVDAGGARIGAMLMLHEAVTG